MEKTREEIHAIIKESYDINFRSINWDGMHDEATNKIVKIIEKNFKKSKKKPLLSRQKGLD